MRAIRIELRPLDVISVLIGIGGLVIAIFFGIRETEPPIKRVEWQVDFYGDLINIDETVPGTDRIEILFDEQPVETIKLVVMTYVNTGTLPVDTSDYREPLSLDFGENVQIYDLAVTTPNSNSVSVNVNIEQPAKIVFEDTLLNPGESFTIQVLGNDFPNDPTIGGRIVGVSNIPLVYYPSLQTTVGSITNFIWFLTGLIIVFTVIIVTIGVLQNRATQREIKKLEAQTEEYERQAREYTRQS